MIDFAKTYDLLAAHRNNIDEMDVRFATADLMAAIARDVRDGELPHFSEDDQDDFSTSFTGYARHRGLLALA
ncbi:hypothetical protein DFR49_3340 [Hephaestia caeni]|uniref:Uncharacterized protein n=1 Tax=Hephaestia caeni TaxID=645617 RepID=A0A397NRW8_9SPHN|nr:hypothetical protein [Hephaestia caeni]RIA37455.1 hypothetical protein DFR49_3340 [Hephaestia caeni]